MLRKAVVAGVSFLSNKEISQNFKLSLRNNVEVNCFWMKQIDVKRS